MRSFRPAAIHVVDIQIVRPNLPELVAANEILDASVGLPPLDQRYDMPTLADSVADLAGPRSFSRW